MNKLLGAVAPMLTAMILLPCASAQYIYVGNAGEDTVSKIDITVPAEVARYATWFTAPDPHQILHLNNAWGGPAPSRIAQDPTGNFYVLDRFFSTPANTVNLTPMPAHLPVLLKIAPSGGIPGPTTSLGSTVLPMLDNSPSDLHLNVSAGEAKDVRILWASEIGTPGSDEGNLGRAVCVDPKGFLWVGIFSSFKYYKVDPNNGNLLPPLNGVSTPGHTPYGCQVDINGKLWSVNLGTSLAEIDTSNATLVGVHDHSAYGGNYSLSLYNDCKTSPPKVTVYISSSAGHSYIAYDAQASSFSTPASVQFSSISVGVDSQGNIFSGESGGSGRVLKSSPTGAMIWDTNAIGSTVPVTDLHGLIVDVQDNVWVIDKASSGKVIRYSGAAGTNPTPVNVGNMPYTYGNPPPPTCGGGTDGGGCAQAKGDMRCLPNGDYSYTFTITNNSGHAISQLLLTPIQGSTFTMAPQLATFNPSLQNGQSTTLTTTISGVKAGDKVCFYVSLLADKEACCNRQVCLTMPPCGGVSPPPTVTSSLPPPLPQQAPRGRRRP